MDEEDDPSEEHPQQVEGPTPAGDAEEPGEKMENNVDGGGSCEQHSTVSPREFEMRGGHQSV